MNARASEQVPFHVSGTASTMRVGAVRLAVRQLVARHTIDPQTVSDIELITSELVTNAIQAATTPDGHVEVSVVVDGDCVVIEVVDDGPGLAVDGSLDDRELPDASAERGRGLALAAMLSRSLRSERVDGRTVLRAEIAI